MLEEQLKRIADAQEKIADALTEIALQGNAFRAMAPASSPEPAAASLGFKPQPQPQDQAPAAAPQPAAPAVQAPPAAPAVGAPAPPPGPGPSPAAVPPVAPATPAAAPAAPPQLQVVGGGSQVSLDLLRSTANDFCRANPDGSHKVLSLLAEYNTDSFTTMLPAQYESAYAKLKALGA